MIIYLGSAQMISNVARIIGGLLVASIIIPKLYGIFTGIGIVIGYLPILLFGVMNGLNRELPFCLGRGERNKAMDYASVVQFWELGLSIISFSFLTFISIYYLFQTNYIFAAGFFTYALSSVHYFYGINYLSILYRTNNDFNKLSNILLISAAVSFVSILLVWKWQFYGLCIRAILTSVVELYFFWKWRPFSVVPKWDLQILKEVLKVGFPIFTVGLVSTLWATLQNTFVLKFGGAEQFGLFALAVMIENSMGIIETSVSHVIYPKMAFEYGAGKGVKELLKISLKPILFSFFVLLFSIAAGWYLIPFFVEWLLPKYIGGIEAARWTLFLLLASILGVNNSIFNVLKKQKDYLISLLIGIFAFIVLLVVLYYENGFSLVIFPQSMLFGKIIQLVIGYFYISKYYRKSQELTR
ncbi:MAG TPA: oligosaccharide flippase family protein [Prolixibacteraceae bacterium]